MKLSDRRMPEFVLREALKPRCGHYEGWEVALAHAYLKASNDSGEWASSGQQRDVSAEYDSVPAKKTAYI